MSKAQTIFFPMEEKVVKYDEKRKK